MNILTTYTLKYLRLNRKRTAVTILGVILSSALICGVFVGGVYGGSITAILLNIPGAPAAIATGIEGYPLAQLGEAASSRSAVSSTMEATLPTMAAWEGRAARRCISRSRGSTATNGSAATTPTPSWTRLPPARW